MQHANLKKNKILIPSAETLPHSWDLWTYLQQAEYPGLSKYIYRLINIYPGLSKYISRLSRSLSKLI